MYPRRTRSKHNTLLLHFYVRNTEQAIQRIVHPCSNGNIRFTNSHFPGRFLFSHQVNQVLFHRSLVALQGSLSLLATDERRIQTSNQTTLRQGNECQVQETIASIEILSEERSD